MSRYEALVQLAVCRRWWKVGGGRRKEEEGGEKDLVKWIEF